MKEKAAALEQVKNREKNSCPMGKLAFAAMESMHRTEE